MFPLVNSIGFGVLTDFVFAFIIGVGFGFVLERAGFGNANKLAMQFYFRDMTVLKVMFTAIVTAMTGLLLLSTLGMLDLSAIYINPTFLWSGIVGGLIMGAGFIIGGFCPGTSVVGAVTGKIDAVFYIAGALLGMFVFGELITIQSLNDLYMLKTEGFSGRLTLDQWLGVRPGVIGFGVLLMALGAFAAAEWAERHFNGASKSPGEETTDSRSVVNPAAI